MDRRLFLRYSFLSGGFLIAGHLFPWAETTGDTSLRIIDAHAHPDRYPPGSARTDTTSTLKAIKELGMVASSFSAVGDMTYLSQGRVRGTDRAYTKLQLEHWIKGLVRPGKIKLVLRSSDVPDIVNSETLRVVFLLLKEEIHWRVNLIG